MVYYDDHITLNYGRRSTRWTGSASGRGRGRCANCGKGLDDLEDAAVGGGRGGAADRGDMDVDVSVGMDVGMGVIKLASLIGSGLLMLLKMVTTTTNSLLFWAFRIKRLEASYVSGWRKVVYKDYQKAELATSNWQVTCKSSLEMDKKSYTTAFHHHRRGWSGTGGSLPTHGDFKPAISFPSPAPSKPAHQVGQPRLVFTFTCLSHIINSFFHRCPPTSSVHWRVGVNIFTRRSKGRAPLGERVRRVVSPHGRNVNITLAISPDMGLLHHFFEQRMVTRATFQAFINELLVILALINEDLLMKKSSSSSTARGRISTSSLFHRSSKIPRGHVAAILPHFSTPSSKPIAAWRVQSNNIWCFLTFRLKFSIFPKFLKHAGGGWSQSAAVASQRVASNWEQHTSANYTTEMCKLVRAYSSVYPCISQLRNHSRLNTILLMSIKNCYCECTLYYLNDYTTQFIKVNAHFIIKFWKRVWTSILLNWIFEWWMWMPIWSTWTRKAIQWFI